MFAMVATTAFRKVKSVLFLIVNLIKRCFCCFKRRRDSFQDLPVAVRDNSQEGNWEDWDGPIAIVTDGGNSTQQQKMSAVEQQIHQYRLEQQKKLSEIQQPPQAVEEESDLFEGLAPSLPKKPQVVIYARPDDDEHHLSNRQNNISVTDALMQAGGDLREWTDDDGETEWGGCAEEVDELIQQQREYQQVQRELRREQQRLAREARKQQIKENKSKLATKLS